MRVQARFLENLSDEQLWEYEVPEGIEPGRKMIDSLDRVIIVVKLGHGTYPDEPLEARPLPSFDDIVV
jgi:hypothetical protein